MDLNQITETVKKLHPGASYVIEYETSAYLKTGQEITKRVKRAVRLGVRYSHMKHMIGKQAKPLNVIWVIDRYVYLDSKGYKLRVTNGAFGKAAMTYHDQNGDVDEKDVEPSSGYRPVVQCIKLENVIAIYKKGERV